jgi:hypothetical protein
MIGKWGGGGTEYLLNQDNDDFSFIIFDGGNKTVTATSEASIGAWSHVVGTYDSVADELKIYVDGILKDELSTGRSVVTGAENFRVGNVSALGVDGKLDNCMVFDTALTSNQVYNLYTDYKNGGQ